jgi:asparagine synthase (glutamine-hydrolysing)
MCGILGILSSKKIELNISEFRDLLKHRGPDFGQNWLANNGQVVFAHRRLSIIDPSINGAQPMYSNCKKYTIMFNGEIYNHLELRNEIELIKNVNWRSFSDTETLIEAVATFGFEKTLPKLNGMFAIAVYDNKNDSLYLARDRFGEKPLYFGFIKGETFCFSSELKPIIGLDSNLRISKKAFNLYTQLSYVLAPLSIFEDIYKLYPGSFFILKNVKKLNHFIPTMNEDNIFYKYKKWWDVSETIKKSKTNLIINDKDLKYELKKKLSVAVKRQMISDVPIGSFLSGGIDSSLVTCLMKDNSQTKVETFSIGFVDKKFDESKYARDIAKILGTNHNELILDKHDCISNLSEVYKIYDEPFADSSQIPTYILSNFAKKKISVALSGDGGDELFGGYNRYFSINKLWNVINFFPSSIRNLITNIILKNPDCLSLIVFIIKNVFKRYDQSNNITKEKLLKLLNKINNVKNKNQLYFSFITEWFGSHPPILEHDENLVESFFKSFLENDELSFEEKMMYCDTVTYLPDDILCKIDRASMYCSLETRVPMLDYELFNFAWQIELNQKISKGKGKIILKEILKDYLPNTLIERPKMGFGVPLSSWLKGPLKDEIKETLLSKEMKNSEQYNFDKIKILCDQFFNNDADLSSKIWNIYMFQKWKNHHKIK